MSFLTGKTEKQSNVNTPTYRLQKDMAKWLRAYGMGNLFPDTAGISMDLQPYRDLFTLQNTRNFAQAKESAGSLTGSGFAEILGRQAGDAATAQGAQMANMIEARRTNDQNVFLQSLLGAMGSPAAGVTYTHSPGLFDYAAQGFSAAAPFLIGGPAGAGASIAMNGMGSAMGGGKGGGAGGFAPGGWSPPGMSPYFPPGMQFGPSSYYR